MASHFHHHGPSRADIARGHEANDVGIRGFIWFAAACQILSGVTLWITKPAQYLADGMFEVKFTLVIVASVVTWFFQNVLRDEAAKWDSAGAVSARGLKFGSATCLLWAGVVIGGRLTAYLGQLYHA